MANEIMEKVLEQVKALTPDEQRQVRKVLDTMLANPPSQKPLSKEDELEQALFKAGLLREIKPPITDFTPYRNRKLATVKGKPVSETIIEERR